MNLSGLTLEEATGSLGNQGAQRVTNGNTSDASTAMIPFPIFFKAISSIIAQKDADLISADYQQLKENKISREEFKKKLKVIVGDNLLRTTITALQRLPSHAMEMKPVIGDN